MLTLSKFVQNFAVLYRAGIPVLHCLHLCQGLVGNQVVAEIKENGREATFVRADVQKAADAEKVYSWLDRE